VLGLEALHLLLLEHLLLLVVDCSKVLDMVVEWLGWQLLLLLLLKGQLITRAALDMLLGEETFQGAYEERLNACQRVRSTSDAEQQSRQPQQQQ
jgi:hypothetical protein